MIANVSTNIQSTNKFGDCMKITQDSTSHSHGTLPQWNQYGILEFPAREMKIPHNVKLSTRKKCRKVREFCLVEWVCVGECACVFQGAKGKGGTGRLLKTIITQNITINMKFSMLQRKKTIQIPERLVLPNAAFSKLRI